MLKHPLVVAVALALLANPAYAGAEAGAVSDEPAAPRIGDTYVYVVEGAGPEVLPTTVIRIAGVQRVADASGTPREAVFLDVALGPWSKQNGSWTARAVETVLVDLASGRAFGILNRQTAGHEQLVLGNPSEGDTLLGAYPCVARFFMAWFAEGHLSRGSVGVFCHSAESVLRAEWPVAVKEDAPAAVAWTAMVGGGAFEVVGTRNAPGVREIRSPTFTEYLRAFEAGAGSTIPEAMATWSDANPPPVAFGPYGRTGPAVQSEPFAFSLEDAVAAAESNAATRAYWSAHPRTALTFLGYSEKPSLDHTSRWWDFIWSDSQRAGHGLSVKQDVLPGGAKLPIEVREKSRTEIPDFVLGLDSEGIPQSAVTLDSLAAIARTHLPGDRELNLLSWHATVRSGNEIRNTVPPAGPYVFETWQVSLGSRWDDATSGAQGEQLVVLDGSSGMARSVRQDLSAPALQGVVPLYSALLPLPQEPADRRTLPSSAWGGVLVALAAAAGVSSRR